MLNIILDFLNSSPALVSAIVAAVISILTLFTKNFIEKRLLLFKLNAEHKFDQRKKIKNVLATNKSHLLRACEDLNHRLWNFSMSDKYRFLAINKDYKNAGHYYFHSFVYRILVVYAWMNKIQDELIHFDATIAGDDDLEFIKFMRFYNRIFTDTAFFRGFDYNDDKPTDHIYHNMFNELHKVVVANNQVITFNEYLKKVPSIENKYLKIFFRILDGVNPNENRLRWNWFQIMKLLNISFLNSYGFDYQKTSDNKMIKAINTPKKTILENNFVFLLSEYKLVNQKSIKHLIKLMKTTREEGKQTEQIGDSLIHWTGRNKTDNEAFDIVKKMLFTQTIITSYCPNFGSVLPEKKTYMFSFTDIPLELSKKHCSIFGQCGIGFKKEKMIEYGANPVFYTTEKHFERIKEINTLINELIQKELDREWKSEVEPYQFTTNQLYSLREYFGFSQEYSYKDSILYFQREWRLNYDTLPHISGNLEKKPGEGSIHGKINGKIACEMKFALSDIEFIVVPKQFKEEASRLVKNTDIQLRIYENEVLTV